MVKSMMAGMRKHRRNSYGIIIVVLISILLLWIWTGFSEEAFLIDDNRTQWYPVIEKAYEDVLSEGRIYYYNFHQMKGMSIAEQGYYGVMNPFMLLSYSIAHCERIQLSTITIYIMIMFVLGNIFFYLACKRVGCNDRIAVLVTLLYCTVGCFATFYYWYYVYNNYFIIPLLLYAFLRFGERREGYFAYGIILALDLYMGNAQYACYHYMFFCILCMGLVFLKKYRYLLKMCTNVSVGVLLSLPMLLLLIEASVDFGNKEGFMGYPVYLFSLLLHSFVPNGILHKMHLEFTLLGTNVMSRRDNLALNMGTSLLVVCVFAMTYLRTWIRKIEEEVVDNKITKVLKNIWKTLPKAYQNLVARSYEEQVMIGCVIALLYFMSLMSGGIVAVILSKMPVIQNFRYLFKAIFVIAPLVNLIVAFGLYKSKGKWKRAAIVLSVLSVCFSICNTYYTIQETKSLFDMRMDKTYAKEKKYTLDMLQKAGIDYQNYRTATFLKYSGVNDECFDYSKNLTRNFATGIGAFALSGYEIATSAERLEEFGAIYSTSEFLTVYCNADTVENLFFSMIEQSDAVQKQLIDNGVKYLIIDKSNAEQNHMVMQRGISIPSSDYEEKIIKEIEAMSFVDVEGVSALNENYDLIELSGVNSLCVDDSMKKVPIIAENMQTLSFEADKPGIYRMAFSYDSHLRAYIVEEGVKESITIREADNGTILIDTSDMYGKVCLTYDDKLCKMGFVGEGMVSVFFLMVLLLFMRQERVEKKQRIN